VTTRFVPALIAGLFITFATVACSAAPSASPTASADTSITWVNQGARQLVPIVVSSDLAAGSNRFLVSVVDPQNKPLAAADQAAKMNFYDLAGNTSSPAVTVDGTYMSVLDRLPGLYRAAVDFPHAGQWGLELTLTDSSSQQQSGRLSFPVRDQSSTPAIGAPAIPSDTPTATTADGIHAISTDSTPDPDFYTTSVKQALEKHEPFFLIFATPAFCRTQTCGPALDVVKSVAADYKDKVTFIHVEPYKLQMANGQLQPVFTGSDLTPVQPTLDWGLPTEPYAFVVDANGKVTAKFEGIASPDELKAALDQVAK
jgi:hypothetical protein